MILFFFFSSRRRHTRSLCDWSSDVCSSDLAGATERLKLAGGTRGVVFLWVPVDARSAPTAIHHRVTMEQGSGDSVKTQELESVAVPVATEAVVIGPPLRGGPW